MTELINYTAKFGLSFNPFLKNTKDVIIETADIKELMIRFKYLVTVRGFGLLTGSPGLGKTTAVRSWSATLNPSLYRVLYSALSTLTVMEFYRNLACQLGLVPSHKKSENFKMIQDEIVKLNSEKRILPIIIIDEANNISGSILNDLKMLFNFDMDSKDKAVVLLVGLPMLNSTMCLTVHESLKQRIIMNYNMSGLTKEEGREYISQKLINAGGILSIFTDNAIEAILNYSNGVPRVINKLCNACLLVASSKSMHEINGDIAMQAINDCEIDNCHR